jgi:L-rhamnose-H+ transport protein
MKRMPAWKWENSWLVYSVVGMIAGPWMLAVLTVPNLRLVYQRASWGVLALVVLCGLGSGVGSALFGLGIARLGLALGFAIVLGIMASAGSVLPMAILHPDKLLQAQGRELILGTILVVVGVAFYAVAGQRRERQSPPAPVQAHHSKFIAGLILCVAAAALSTLINFSFLYGSELQKLAVSLGARTRDSANPVWALALTASFVPNGAYAIYLMCRNRSWSIFLLPPSRLLYGLGGVSMGAFWFGSIGVYGMGATVLGSLGGIVGWPIFMSTIILTANFWGAMTGEWAKAGRLSIVYSCAGMAVLLVAIYVISFANRM